ncbi:glycosyltransferase [Sphingomonas soli]|uniref:glycosyltransferase n=1 Tax=Sphingomonas soli TaxID=266127 RepID=UPI00082C9D3E|nr:glycosyltransferase [Sphingomonas soli]
MLHRTYSKSAQMILTYAQRLQGGGVERAMLRMADGWLKAGRRVTLVLGSREGPLAAEIPEGIELRELGNAKHSALFSLADHVREVRPDVIFCPGNHYSGIAALTRLRLGAQSPPIVAKVSNALVRPELSPAAEWGYRCWLRLHPRFLDAVVAMTPAMASEAIAEMRMPASRVHVIANPPATARTGAAPVALPEGRYIIGVGRLEPQKRWDRLLHALPRLADQEIKLLLLGEGTARGALEAQVAALGLGGRVSMPGHAGDPLPALQGAALAVLTSDYEGVPGVLREALSVGTPVVTTESSVAVREIVTSPDLGTVINREDATGLVAALDHWLAPGRARPAPVIPAGDPVAEYLALFDSLTQPQAQSQP